MVIGDTPIPDENDLIEVRVDALPGMNNLVLEVDWRMRLFTSHEGGTPIELTEHQAFVSRRTAPFSFSDGTLVVFAEWHGNHGIGDIKLIDVDSNDAVVDMLTHTFQSIVIGFSGETAGFFGFNQLTDYLDHPTFDIAVDFYKQGYDVHYYDVWHHFPLWVPPQALPTAVLLGPATTEVKKAIEERKVSHVGAFGWSHGGGATQLLMNSLERQQKHGIISRPFAVDATAYIDAVSYDYGLGHFNPIPERRRPVLTQAHANWYQTQRDPFRGASVAGSDIDEDLTADAVAFGGQSHVSIAILVWQRKLLLDFFEEKMSTR